MHIYIHLYKAIYSNVMSMKPSDNSNDCLFIIADLTHSRIPINVLELNGPMTF